MKFLFGMVVVIAGLLCSAAGYEEEGLQVGAEAPEFSVVSGEAEELKLEDVLGKVVLVFFETRFCCELNRDLKDELNYRYEELDGWHQDELKVLAVTDCRASKKLTRGEWKKGLRGKSEEERWTIYGDWSGEMLRDFNFVEDDANFMIIDRAGNVVYYTYGVIDWDVSDEIFELLNELIYAEDELRLPKREPYRPSAPPTD